MATADLPSTTATQPAAKAAGRGTRGKFAYLHHGSVPLDAATRLLIREQVHRYTVSLQLVHTRIRRPYGQDHVLTLQEASL